MIAKADIRRVQEWMGHADVQTTMRYLHYAPRADDAALVAKRSRSKLRRTFPPARPDATISSFHGIVILMYSNEGAHAVRHFHARYGGHKASIGFDGTLIAGESLTGRATPVRSWAAQHRAELEANWDRARIGQRLEASIPSP